MYKIELRNKILNIILAIAFIIGIAMHTTSNGVWLGWLSTLALLAGFINVYFTTRRSKHFIYPDLLWILFTVATLVITKNYTDITLYAFYFFVAFYQYRNWKNNENVQGEAKILKADKTVLVLIILGLILSLIQILLFMGGQSNNIVLGSLISGLGIAASVILARRYYFAEILYILVNAMQIYLLFVSALYQTSLIPAVFLANSVVFLIFNKGDK